jgi:hypothetical protein
MAVYFPQWLWNQGLSSKKALENPENTYRTKGYTRTMEQRARTHADLDAMLIGQKSVPKGCRVLNVSPQGMMLQCEPDGRLLTFRDSDLVDIHLTVQHGGGRKKFAIPAIVNRVDIKSIDVVFQHPNSELLKLIEAYRVSDAHMMKASIAHSPHEGGAKVTALPNKPALTANEPDEETGGRRNSRRTIYPVLATVILSVCIAAGTYLYTSGIDSRISVLETITINQTNELAEMRSRIFSSSLQEGRYASLNARLQALTDAFGTLEGKLDTVISRQPVTADKATEQTATETIATGGNEIPISITTENPPGAGTDTSAKPSSRVAESGTGQTTLAGGTQAVSARTGSATTRGQSPETRDADTTNPDIAASQQATAAVQEASAAVDSTGNEKSGAVNEEEKAGLTASIGTGPWIINLLSSRSKRDTDRLAEIAAAHGIPVVQSRAIVKGKEYWRLQVTGFSNASEAKNYALPVKQKLGIKDVWIFRQKG